MKITSYKGNLAITKILLKNGANPNLEANYGGTTALMLAVLKGHEPIVVELLAQRANPNLQDQIGNTALMFAVRFGNLRVAKMLLDKGADSNLQDYSHKTTALMLAVKQGNQSIINALLAAEAKTCVQNKQGNTAADLAPSSLPKEIKNRLKCFHCELIFSRMRRPTCMPIRGLGRDECACNKS